MYLNELGRWIKEPMFCACSFHGNSMNNLLSYCGLCDARISASEKDLPVPLYQYNGPVLKYKRTEYIIKSNCLSETIL